MMVAPYMRMLMILCGMLFVSTQSAAQRNYFIFIQSDQRSPFYVRMGTETFSSSAIGHITLSGLRDSTYQINIGFPRNQYPEQSFTVPLKTRDRGFELKNLAGQGWVLYDWQTMEFIKAPSANANGTTSAGVAKKDSYSLLLAGVVDDSAVLYNIVARVDTSVSQTSAVTSMLPATHTDSVTQARTRALESDTVTAIVLVSQGVSESKSSSGDSLLSSRTPIKPAADSIAADSGTTPQRIRIADSAAAAVKPAAGDTLVAVAQKEMVVVQKESWRVRENISSTGTNMVFVDRSSPEKDTINITIEYNADPTTIPSSTVGEQFDSTEKAKIVIINSDCRKFATESDVDKLRVQMLKEDQVKERLKPAQKLFRSMCFSSKQIKALTELFNTDELKFRFLSASYPSVSDSSEFKNLVVLLTETQYVEQFKTMVRL